MGRKRDLVGRKRVWWNNLWLSACVHSYQHLKQTRGGMGGELVQKPEKMKLFLTPENHQSSRGKNKALESRSTGDIHSLGNSPLCPTILGSSWGE